MREKTALLAIMLAACLQAAGVSCEWSGEAKPASLADGAVTFRYDGSGFIQSLIASPTAGDTIILTGDEMPFAADAKIQIATEGRLEISNAVTCAGNLSVTGCAAVITRSWNDGVASTLADPTQALLPTNSFKLMFENMDLDEWEPVEFRGDIPANIGSGWYFPNHFKAEYFKRRTVDGKKQMLVDMMARGTDWTKAVRILVQQDGDDVYGMTLGAWYGGDTFEGLDVESARGLTAGMDENHIRSWEIAAPGNPVGGYGISQLTMKRICCSSVCCLAGTLTVPSENKVFIAADIHVEGMIGAVTSPSSSASPTVTPNFHVDGSLSLVGDSCLNSFLRGRISGVGVVSIEGRNEIQAKDKNGITVPGDQEYSHESYVGYTAFTRNMTNRQLFSLTNAVAEFYGKECSSKPKAKLYHLKTTTPATDGASAALIGQFQGSANGNLYCFYAMFEQIGNDIKIHATTAWKIVKTDAVNEGVDFDIVKDTESATKLSVVEAWNGDGIAMRSPRFYFSLPRAGLLGNTAFKNEMTGSAHFIVQGTQMRTQVYNASYSNSLPSCGKVEIARGGLLQMLADGVNQNGYNGGRAVLQVNEGGCLYQFCKNPFANTQKVVLDGGAMYLHPMPDVNYASGPYLQYLVLKNGASVDGGGVLMGNRVQDPCIAVCGDEPSEFNCQLTLQATSNNGARNFNWRILNVTGDEDPDLIMNGNVRYYNFGSAAVQLSTNTTMRKYGDGTILLKGSQNQFGLTRIFDGEWRFGASGIANGTGYVLCGGRIGAAKGTSNTIGALKVEGAGSIVLADDATMEFDDTSSEKWTGIGRVNVVFDGELTEGRLRFGTTENGLTASQIARMRHGDLRVRLTETGWLVDSPKTFRIIIR